jgi:putative transposase
MEKHTTIFSQILKLVPKLKFEKLAKPYQAGQALRKMTRWTQFVVMAMGQLTHRSSLRDTVTNALAQQNYLSQLGCVVAPRSTLSRTNNEQPYQLYEELFSQMLTNCQSLAPGHGFKFKNKMYSLDASTIDLCLSLFGWAKFRKTKAGIKLHTVLDHEGQLPACVVMTDAKMADVTVGRKLQFQRGSLVVYDRGYNDYQWFLDLDKQGIYFVTRLKRGAHYRVVERKETNKAQGITSDQIIAMKIGQGKNQREITLRRVGYYDSETQKHYYYLTNNFAWSAKTIANIYKSRWQIELFFKWIKQNLKIKVFLGRSRNAVLTQIWIALCVYLTLAYMKFISKIGITLQAMIRLLHINLFAKRDLASLFGGLPIKIPINSWKNKEKLIKFVGH